MQRGCFAAGTEVRGGRGKALPTAARCSRAPRAGARSPPSMGTLPAPRAESGSAPAEPLMHPSRLSPHQLTTSRSQFSGARVRTWASRRCTALASNLETRMAMKGKGIRQNQLQLNSKGASRRPRHSRSRNHAEGRERHQERSLIQHPARVAHGARGIVAAVRAVCVVAVGLLPSVALC